MRGGGGRRGGGAGDKPTWPKQVTLYEVGPRDGLQNIDTPLSVETKIRFIDALSQAGLRAIEVGAFVSPRAVPQMADSDQVFGKIRRAEGVRYPVLVPNAKGMEAALAAGVKEIALFTAASETFNQKNINASIAESLERFRPVVEMAREARIRVLLRLERVRHGGRRRLRIHAHGRGCLRRRIRRGFTHDLPPLCAPPGV